MSPNDPLPESVPVVIVGAGPAGVTVGTLLTRYGVPCLILERHPDIYQQPRAVHCDDEVCRILDRLGLYEAFTTVSRPGLGMRLLDPKMRVLEEIHVPGLGPHGYPRSVLYDQPDLEALLRTKYAEQPGALFRGNAQVTAVARHGDVVRVSFTDRSDGSEHTVDADYVFGCDGANSLVRTTVGATMMDLHFEQRWLVIDVDTDADLSQWSGTHQLCDPSRAGSYMRVSDTRYRWEFQLLDGETADDFQTLTAVAPLINPWVGEVPVEQLTLVRVTDYTFRARVADRWRNGRVFLLGDAAHTTPPFIGQGLCAGMRDALNLSWKLAGVLSDELPSSVLDTYQQEREPHVRRMIRIAILVGQSMTAGGRLGTLSRRVLFPMMFHVPGLQRVILDGFHPALHASDLVIKSRRRRELAGTVCPNVVLPQGIRIDKVIAHRFALITSATLSTQQRAELDRRGAAVVVAAPGDPLSDWLHHGRATTAIVRPDGAVLQAGNNTQAMCESVPSIAAARSAKP